IGNIDVAPEIFEATAFYAFSGHKWLLGEPTLGILYANATKLAEAYDRLNPRLVKSRPFSYWHQNDGQDETIDMDPYITLNAMLGDLNRVGAAAIERHNTDLAITFRRWMARLALVDVPRIQQRGGI